MKLQYSGREEIPTGLDAVWAFVTDPGRVASCVPDMVESTVAGPSAADATVQVSVGPIRGKLKLRVALSPDARSHRMIVTIGGGGFGSVVDVSAATEIAAVTPTATVLDWKATVELRGPVVAMGSGALDVQAKRVITQTFANVKTRLTSAPEQTD